MKFAKKYCPLLLILLTAGNADGQWVIAHRAVISPHSDTTYVAEQFFIVNDCILDTSSNSYTDPYLTIVFHNIKAECLSPQMCRFPEADNAQFTLDTLDNRYLHAIMNLDAKLSYVEIICQYSTFSQIGTVHLGSLKNMEIFAKSGYQHKHKSRRVIKRIARGKPGFAGALNDWTFFKPLKDEP